MKLFASIGLSLSLLLAAGCGEPSLIILEVRGELSVPDEVNQLEILVISPDDREQLGRVNLSLGAEHAFPIEVSLEPSDTTPTALETEVRASLDGVPVAAVRAIHDWQRDRVSRVRLPPLEPL